MSRRRLTQWQGQSSHRSRVLSGYSMLVLIFIWWKASKCKIDCTVHNCGKFPPGIAVHVHVFAFFLASFVSEQGHICPPSGSQCNVCSSEVLTLMTDHLSLCCLFLQVPTINAVTKLRVRNINWEKDIFREAFTSSTRRHIIHVYILLVQCSG